MLHSCARFLARASSPRRLRQLSADWMTSAGELSIEQSTLQEISRSHASGTPHPGALPVRTMASSPASLEENKPFYEQIMSLISEMQLADTSPDVAKSRRVIQFQTPDEVREMLGLQLKASDAALPRAELLQLCRKAAELSVRTSDFRFRNQLFGSADEFALGGAFLTEALNTNSHTFEVAPVFIMCEATVLERVRQLVGWEEGDGIMAAGGSMSNQYGLALARYRRHPDVKKTGMFGMKPLVAFTSADAHYSISKAAHWHGYGSDNVVNVATDERGRMVPAALEAAVKRVLEEGREPLVVNATCGTTVLGAYDPLEDIANICERHGLWLHADAAWGGSVLLSAEHRHLIAGMARVDSMAWNPHKLLGAPLQCSVFVSKHPGLLQQCNGASASYLFQQDKYYDMSYDVGDKSIQCGRKVDAFKLWVMWKARGEKELEKMVDTAYSAAKYCGEQVARREGFRPVLKSVGSQCTNVCFWYIPERLRGQEETEEWWSQVARVAPQIKERMVRKGTLMVGYQPLPHKGLVNFFRLVFTAVPPMGEKEVNYMLDQIESLGKNL